MVTKSEIQLKVDIIEGVLDDRINISDAQKLLGKLKRTIYRYTKGVQRLWSPVCNP